jgi:hypothetical protein
MKQLPLPELIDKLDKIKFPDEIQVGNVWYRNPRKMADYHIWYLKANPGNKRYKPYYDRLLELYYTLIGGEWVVKSVNNGNNSNSHERR